MTTMQYSNDRNLDTTKRRLFPEEDDERASNNHDNDVVSTSTSMDEETNVIQKETNEAQAQASEAPTAVTSPTSVVNVITTSTTILMGEEGAEVALLHDVTNLPPPDPSNNSDSFRKTARNNSLLDVEKTPIRTPTNPRPPAVSTSSAATAHSTWACDSTTDGLCDDYEGGHAYLERTITTFLEDPVMVGSSSFPTCTGWQAWSYFGFFDRQPQEGELSTTSKENIRSVLRHRASQSLRTRKSAVRNLRRNLAPFVHSPARSPARAPSLFRNRSFSVSDHKSAIVRVSKDREPMRTSFADVLQLCTMPENTTLDSPEFFRVNTNTILGHDDICYDSDPEDFTRRRRSNFTTKSFVDDNANNSSYYQRTEYPGISYSPSRALIDVNNDDIFHTIVQEVFNQTTTLVLHPSSSSSESTKPRSSYKAGPTSSRPIAVDAWLERGQNLTYRLIQPKWMWKPKSVNGSNMPNVSVSPRCIELLDITRILKAEDSDKGSITQPFAKQSHCFLIKSIHNDEFCFEAPNSMERDRLVYALKLVIARFGAKILVGDPQVYWEFFSMADATVLGEAPDVLGVVCDEYDDYDDEEDDIDQWKT
jgi:hypothetical protein